jgi:hypothetical protein
MLSIAHHQASAHLSPKLRPAGAQAGWGDDHADAAALNPHYDPELYGGYSAAARRNLARLDENRIDYDLLEELVAHIDASYEEGAILVFLPGACPAFASFTATLLQLGCVLALCHVAGAASATSGDCTELLRGMMVVWKITKPLGLLNSILCRFPQGNLRTLLFAFVEISLHKRFAVHSRE